MLSDDFKCAMADVPRSLRRAPRGWKLYVQVRARLHDPARTLSSFSAICVATLQSLPNDMWRFEQKHLALWSASARRGTAIVPIMHGSQSRGIKTKNVSAESVAWIFTSPLQLEPFVGRLNERLARQH
jgi:hypothetical protein